MAGARQPTAVVQANGRKHLTRAEVDARLDREVRAPTAQKAKPPKWLPESLRKDFRAIGKQLIELGIYSDLDADTLGRYLVAQHQWLTATAEAERALGRRDATAAADWTNIQDKYFKQARNCATDLGLTISSRCRLVMPQSAADDAANEDDDIMRTIYLRTKAMVG